MAFAECPEVAIVMEQGWLAAHRGEERRPPNGVNRIQWLRGFERYQVNQRIGEP